MNLVMKIGMDGTKNNIMKNGELKLYRHQQNFKDTMQDNMLLVWEGGLGKTVAACVWLKDGRDADALVVCPKRVVKKWEKELVKWGTKGTVVSKENFKKMDHRSYSALVVDEADEFASPLFTPQRSKLSESMYNLIRSNPSMPRLLLTATPIRSTPWNLHTLLCFMGKYIDWKKWREHFFVLQKRGYNPRMAWYPVNGWQKKIQPTLKKYADIVLLKDCVDDVPPITEEIVHVKNPVFVNEEWEGSKAFIEEHKHEQLLKAKEIIKIGKKYRKILVVAHYREQCAQLQKELSKDRQTFMVRGGIKDQEAIIQEAQDTDECYFVVQASLGAGFDGDSFSCIVFASMSYSVRDFVQMKFRVRRIHNLHPVKYIFLNGGRCDTRVHNTIKAGRDFVPSEWN